MASDLDAALAAEQEAILDRAQAERRNLSPAEESQYLVLGRLRRFAEQLTAWTAEDDDRAATLTERGVFSMTREMRDIAAQLAEAEEAARKALEARDLERAEKAMERVRALRAQLRREEDARMALDHEVAEAMARDRAAKAQKEHDFGQIIIKAGWDLHRHPVVTLPLAQALPTVETWRVRPPEGILPLGKDTRWLYPLLPSRNLDGATTAVEDFRQTSRAVTGSVERDPAATDEKARLNVAVEHVVEKVRQLAVVIPDIPNQVLESIDTAAAFFTGEGQFAVEQALDQHVLAQIQAANPASSYTGSDLIERVRHAIATMRADGVNPDVLVLSPADAAALDLTKTSDGLYIYQTREVGAASPLFGLRIVEHPSVTAPMLLDTRQLGVLYLGTLRVAADAYTGFSRNVTNLRLEMNALMHVRNAKAAHLIVQAV
ncbi:MAG: phage major capsid protein [Firmicutes bacterium]|nr:phage major capsid protein [Bacillota bacterium]